MIALALFVLAMATIWALCTAERPLWATGAPAKPDGRRPLLPIPNRGFLAVMFVILMLFVGACPGPMDGIRWAPQSGAMQTTRTIALAMSQYAQDHDGAYPDGASSTEVFQKLLDGNYVSDPALFYQPLPGKTPPAIGAKLKPENVGYDVTSGVQAASPDFLPIVFLTGFRIDYRPGGGAVSLVRPFPQTVAHFSDLFAKHGMRTCLFDGLPVGYKNDNGFWRQSSFDANRPTRYTPDGFGIVPNVIPPDFDAHGETYRQLTPEGVLK